MTFFYAHVFLDPPRGIWNYGDPDDPNGPDRHDFITAYGTHSKNQLQ